MVAIHLLALAGRGRRTGPRWNWRAHRSLARQQSAGAVSGAMGVWLARRLLAGWIQDALDHSQLHCAAGADEWVCIGIGLSKTAGVSTASCVDCGRRDNSSDLRLSNVPAP